jgi:hypothetical protein
MIGEGKGGWGLANLMEGFMAGSDVRRLFPGRLFHFLQILAILVEMIAFYSAIFCEG